MTPTAGPAIAFGIAAWFLFISIICYAATKGRVRYDSVQEGFEAAGFIIRLIGGLALLLGTILSVIIIVAATTTPDPVSSGGILAGTPVPTPVVKR